MNIDSSLLPELLLPALLRRAAAAAAQQQHYAASTLYLVATPIGNLADLSLRAIHVLGRVDAVACEDTRVTTQLLRHLGLDVPLIALHEHNENAAAEQVATRLAQGASVAYVSDAGTPAVSDPGAALVAAVRRAGFRAVPIPGASSVLAALSVAGDAPGRDFVFVGFLPSKGGERRSALQAVLATRSTQVLFEAPHRIEALARSLAEAAPQRTITLCRELTKQFEQVHTLTAAEAPAWLAADPNHRRGEFVVVLHALPLADKSSGLAPAQLQTLTVLLRELPLRQAVSLAAEITGASRNSLYDEALRQQGGAG